MLIFLILLFFYILKTRDNFKASIISIRKNYRNVWKSKMGGYLISSWINWWDENQSCNDIYLYLESHLAESALNGSFNAVEHEAAMRKPQ